MAEVVLLVCVAPPRLAARRRQRPRQGRCSGAHMRLNVAKHRRRTNYVFGLVCGEGVARGRRTGLRHRRGLPSSSNGPSREPREARCAATCPSLCCVILRCVRRPLPPRSAPRPVPLRGSARFRRLLLVHASTSPLCLPLQPCAPGLGAQRRQTAPTAGSQERSCRVCMATCCIMPPGRQSCSSDLVRRAMLSGRLLAMQVRVLKCVCVCC